MPNNNIRTGVVGLGAMGAPMARHIAAQGMLDSVWNRTTDKAEMLAGELGVQAAASPAELAARCNVILVCVSADRDLLEVVEALKPGLEAGDTLIDTSTVSPLTAKAIARDLETLSVAFIDAPVSGGVEGAIHGRLSVMAGGDSADLSRIRPVLKAFSATLTHMGDVGAGQATKAVNQVMVGGIAEAVCEALALGEKLNLPSQRLLSVMGAGAAGSWFLEHRGKTMLEDQFQPGFKCALLLKDLRICKALARELDIHLPLVDLSIEDYRELVGEGDGESDTSALIRLKRKSALGKAE
jgi:3-hydroxyisobutyrate dehydrogenase